MLQENFNSKFKIDNFDTVNSNESLILKDENEEIEN